MIRAATYLSLAVVASAAFATTADACALRCRASACYSCDPCSSGCGSCGYDSCGSCGACDYGCCCYDACGGCGCLDKLKAKMACRRAARQARKCCGDCGCGSSCCGGCGDCGSCGGCGSCGDGGCAIGGSSGCSNCQSGAGGEVMYDSTQPVETPAADAPAAPPIPDPSAQMMSPFRQAAMRTVANTSLEIPSFDAAFRLVEQRSSQEALQALMVITEARPDDALALYCLALAYYDLGDTEEAQRTLARAADAERAQPLRDWGRRMQRIQGQRRLWLESARGALVSREL